jgi:hypothetical protein
MGPDGALIARAQARAQMYIYIVLDIYSTRYSFMEARMDGALSSQGLCHGGAHGWGPFFAGALSWRRAWMGPFLRRGSFMEARMDGALSLQGLFHRGAHGWGPFFAGALSWRRAQMGPFLRRGSFIEARMDGALSHSASTGAEETLPFGHPKFYPPESRCRISYLLHPGILNPTPVHQ